MKIKWEKIVYVKEAVLMLDAEGLRHQRPPKIIDNKYQVKHQTYLYLDGDIYYSEDQINEFNRLIEKNLDRLPGFMREIQAVVDRFAHKLSVFNSKKISKLTNKDLIFALREFLLNYQNALSTLYIPIPLDRVPSLKLRARLNKKFREKAESMFIAITPLMKAHDVTNYHSELLKLALARKQPVAVRKEATRLANKYSHLGVKFYLGKPLDTAVVLADLKHIQNPKKEIKQKRDAKKREMKEFKRAEKALGNDKISKIYASYLREAIFLRTYRLERICQGEANSLVLLSEIGKRIGLSGLDLTCLRFSEIEQALVGKIKITKSLVAQRKKPYALFSADGKMKFYFGKDYKKFVKTFKFKIHKASEVKGQVAYPGLVTGKVRILRGDHDIPKLRRGEILITRMTTPDYIFAMQKSSAIVTDVGGVTSHASVVSRELGKPCVIGTNYATQIFKTGDLVEVDANKGIVRKI